MKELWEVVYERASQLEERAKRVCEDENYKGTEMQRDRMLEDAIKEDEERDRVGVNDREKLFFFYRFISWSFSFFFLILLNITFIYYFVHYMDYC